jgi:hypothetical protein
MRLLDAEAGAWVFHLERGSRRTQGLHGPRLIYVCGDCLDSGSRVDTDKKLILQCGRCTGTGKGKS